MKRQLVGAGSWKSPRNADDLGWQIQLKHFDNDSLSGRLSVVGSPSIGQARIEGQITGSDVYGAIVDDAGTQLGTFTGAITAPGTATGGGMSGTYTTTDGDSGSWAWEGIRRQTTDAQTTDVAATDQPATDTQTTDSEIAGDPTAETGTTDGQTADAEVGSGETPGN